MKKFKINKKASFIFFNIVGIVIVLLGGVKILAFTIIFIVGFLGGKYLEKGFQILKDYRLLQKVNKISYSQVEIENIKKENEELKNLIIRVNRNQNSNVPVNNKQPVNIYDELENYEFNPKVNY